MIKKKKYRTIIFYKDYFKNFFVNQRDKVKDKIIWTIELIEDLERIPEIYLKHIENTMGFLKYASNKGVTFFGFSVFLTREN